MNKEKIIFDMIHGYIAIDRDMEKIINDECFQRLKHIQQTTSYHLYPSTNHTRFEHSLGTMKLATDFYNRLEDDFRNKLKMDCIKNLLEYFISSEFFNKLKNLEDIIQNDLINKSKEIIDCNDLEEQENKIHLLRQDVIKQKDANSNNESSGDWKSILNEYDEKVIQEIEKRMIINRFHLVYAALLHDIGHAPLSHLGEKFYKMEEIKENILKKATNSLFFQEQSTWDKGSPHEWMSCLFILQENLTEQLKNAFSNIKEKSSLQNPFHNSPETFDYEYIVRIITGNLYKDTTKWDRNIIISILNSRKIDVDKLDYLMRDGFMSGMHLPNIDIERLLQSLMITKNLELGFSKVGVSALQKIIEARDNLYLYAINHHKVVYTDYLIEHFLSHLVKLSRFNKSGLPSFINKERLYKLENKKLSKPLDSKIAICYTKDKDYHKTPTLERKNNITEEEENKCREYLESIKYLPYKEVADFEESDYFSVNAIINNLITDHEVYTLINKIKNKYPKDDHSISVRTNRLLEQLRNRNFLSSAWKSLQEFQAYMINIEEKVSRDIIKMLCSDITNDKGNELRKSIVKRLCKATKSGNDELFLVTKPHKFYTEADIRAIEIHYDDEVKTIPLAYIVPPRKYEETYDKVAFFLYCLPGQEKLSRDEFAKFAVKYLVEKIIKNPTKTQ